MTTLNLLLEKIIPNKTYLYYVDRNDSLDGYEKQIQDCIHNQSYEYLDEVLNDAYSEQEWDNTKRYFKEFKSDLISKGFKKKKVKKFCKKYKDFIEDKIRENSSGDIIEDLMRNTSKMICHYDTGYEMDSNSWSWNSKRINQELRDIKKFLKIKNKDYDDRIKTMICQASYGGNLLIYFELDELDKFIRTEDFNSVKFKNAHIGIIDHHGGSGDITELNGHEFTIDYNPKNLFLEKTIKYNWTYAIAGMVRNWCEDTIVEFSKRKQRLKIVESETNKLLEQEKKYNETWKKGECTFGDMDITRHKNTPYQNDFPCGNKCTSCGTFWID